MALDCGIRLRGSIDLVERNAEGHLRVTDHKTGKVRVKTDSIVEGGASLQPVLYALAVEKLLGIEVPKRAQYIRALYAELGRITNHLLNIATFALDVGAMTQILWGFEEREKIMEFYDRVCGARLHAAYFRPGGVHLDLPDGLSEDILAFCDAFPAHIDDVEGLLTDNRIFRQRTVGIGVISSRDAID